MDEVVGLKQGARRVLGLVTVLVAVACSGDDGGGGSAALVNKAQDCGILTEGRSNMDSDPNADCFGGCLSRASCDEVEAFVCKADLAFSADLEACLERCLGTFICDGGYEMSADVECDGYDDCDDGSDERDCLDNDDVFVCADGGQAYPEDECDGGNDCVDGSDEHDGCEYFTCKNGERVPATEECNLGTQCSDGSDEHDGCAKLTCDNDDAWEQ